VSDFSVHPNGLFITLEGGEGAGKSTLASRLAEDLTGAGHQVVSTREPGAGRIGRAIRSIVLDEDNIDLYPRVEALLFAADRAQHVAELIRPALDRGDTVICDRYIDSSVAYQGYARDLGAEGIAQLSSWGTQGLIPHLTILIDVSPQVGLLRKIEQQEVNRMEGLDIAFHETVRAAFLDLADRNQDRIVVIDGDRDLEDVYVDVLNAVHAHISRS
jgi:dTMP kinase